VRERRAVAAAPGRGASASRRGAEAAIRRAGRGRGRAAMKADRRERRRGECPIA